MKTSGLFPVSNKILPIWNNLWIILFVWFLFLFIIPVTIKSVWDSDSYTLNSITSAANAGSVIGIVGILLVCLWDIYLFAIKAGRPLKKLAKSIYIEDSIDELQRARRDVRGILVVGVLTLLAVAFAVLIFTTKKDNGYMDGLVLSKLPGHEFIKTYKRLFILGVCGVALVFGFISYLIKYSFIEKWNVCVYSYPHSNFQAMVAPKPGISKVWFVQVYLLLLVLSAGLTFVLAANFWKPNWISWIGHDTSDMSFNNPFYQGLLVGCAAIGLLLFIDYLGHITKSKKAVDAAMKKQQLFERDVYEIVRTNKSVLSMMGLQYWAMVIWFFGTLSVVLLNDAILKNMNAKGFFQLFSVLAMALITFTVIPMMSTQATIKRNLNACHTISISKNRHLLSLASYNVDL